MTDFEVGDAVAVMDPGLLMLQQFAPKGSPPNNHGFVLELDYGEENEVMIEFPIGDDPIEEHSQVAPYPKSMLLKLEAE